MIVVVIVVLARSRRYVAAYTPACARAPDEAERIAQLYKRGF